MSMPTWSDVALFFIVGILLGPIVYRVDYWAFRKFADWCKANGRELAFVAFGFVVGALVAFVLGDRPHDAIVGLIGSFAGIAAAVGGGLWLWQVQDARSVKRTLDTVRTSCDSLAPALMDLHYTASYGARGMDFSTIDVLNSSERATMMLEAFTYRAKRYENRIADLPSELQIGLFDFEMQLRLFADQMSEFSGAAQNALAQGSDVTAVRKLAEDLVTRIELVALALEDFSPETFPSPPWHGELERPQVML